jgi:TolB-like protein
LPAVVLAAVAVVVLGAMALVVHLGDRHGPRAAPLLSLAVLPFKATGDAATDPSTDTFTREITAALGQSILGSSIIANSAVAPYRGTLTDVRAVGKSLNVRYVLEGDIAHEGGEVVVGLVLVDALTAKQVWSERIRTPAAKVGVWPELPVLKAAKAVHLALWDVEQRRLAMQPLDEANPLEMVFHAWMIDTSTRKGLEKFNGLCEEALRLDPNLPAALTCKASAIFAEMALDTASSHPKLENELDDLSQRAIATSSSDAMVWRLRSNVLRMQHQWAAAFEANARAIQLDPEFAVDLYTRADYLVLTGQPEEALPLLMRAADISPTQVSLFQRVACHAYLSMGRFGDAINSCERSVTSTEPWNVSVDLAVAYANQGDAAKAAAAKVRVLARKPEFNMAWYRAWGMRQTDNKDYWEQYDKFIVPGLRKAGFAEK